MSHMLRKIIRSCGRKRKVHSEYLKNSSVVQGMESNKSLLELGYAFNSEGKLRKLEDGQPGSEPFQFNISDQHQKCQANYEEIGSAVSNYIYNLLDTQENLMRLPVPKGSTENNGTFIFVSKDYDLKDTLMVLIHGSGVVRAGQWARSLIINESLDMGSQIPYIRKAIVKDYGVMLLNTNDNYTHDGKKIKNSETAEEHALYVWNTYISNVKAESVVIVAHSYGGVVTVTLADKLKDFEQKVKAIALTDSVHCYSNIKITKHMKQVAKNWISSDAPLDTPMNSPEFDITRVSAGHQKHEMTSHSCIDSVFKFFEEKISKK